MESMNDLTKRIVCPDHPDHEAILYLYGHKYEGIWECGVDRVSGGCEHAVTHVEPTVSLRMGIDGPIEEEGKINVCDACELEVSSGW